MRENYRVENLTLITKWNFRESHPFKQARSPKRFLNMNKIQYTELKIKIRKISWCTQDYMFYDFSIYKQMYTKWSSAYIVYLGYKFHITY